MKKFVTLSVLSMGIIFLAGCGQLQTDQSQPITSTPVPQPVVNGNQNTNQKIIQSQDIVYTNSTYGFTLTFPKTWVGYTAKNRTLDWGTLGTSDSIDFGFSATESLFNVNVHTKSQWEKIQAAEGPMPVYLGENDNYVFGYDQAQDPGEGAIAERSQEIPSILKTFEIIK